MSQAFDRQPIGAFIGVKRMGELGFEPFFTAMKLKYDKEEEAHERAMELWSQWEYFLNHDWHPFKVIKDNGGKAVVCILKYSHFFLSAYLDIRKIIEEVRHNVTNSFAPLDE